MPTINPTIGRKVYFYEGDPTLVERFFGTEPLDPLQAYDATIAFVHPEGTVSLDVTSHVGHRNFIGNVELRDPAADGSDHHGAGTAGYATWMPYQVGQAKAATPAAAGFTGTSSNLAGTASSAGSADLAGSNTANVTTSQYSDGASATGSGNLPPQSPAQQDAQAAPGNVDPQAASDTSDTSAQA